MQHHSHSSSLEDAYYQYYSSSSSSPTSSHRSESPSFSLSFEAAPPLTAVRSNYSSQLPAPPPPPGTSSHLSSTATTTTTYSTDPATRVRKTASLAQINVPSFSAFRSQLPNAVKRSHPDAQPSPRAVSLTASEKPSPRIAEPASRPFSLDSFQPPPPPPPPQQSTSISSRTAAEEPRFGDTYRLSHAQSPTTGHDRNASIDARLVAGSASSSVYSTSRPSSIPIHAAYAHGRTASHAPRQSVSSLGASTPLSPAPGHSQSASMTAVQQNPTPTMTLHLDGIQRTLSDESLGAESTGSASRIPKSPTATSRLGNFFNWKSPNNKSDSESSPTTTFSDRSLSPLPSPGLVKTVQMEGAISPARLTPSGLEVRKGDLGAAAYFDNPQTPLLLGDDATNAHVRELERELAYVSQELAGSIRREMELEDEMDRIRAEFTNTHPHDPSRRGSDYFSDSGASSTRFPISDVDGKIELLEKQLRKVEQHKANLQAETASRVQTELSRRRDLEELVRDLEDQVQQHAHGDGNRGSLEGRLEELESSLDETRRRLGQERQAKDNFEDLYTATKEAAEKYRDEADNLRDEVVPQLKARVEGLEADAARMQQELYSLRDHSNSRMENITEDGGNSSGGRFSLGRSASLARSGSRRGGSISKDGGRQRSGSMSGTHPEAVKEIEDQRDALHKALKLLINRHEKQQREHTRAIKNLTNAKDKAESIRPGNTTYQREVTFLKEEVTMLRKRTEDALEQKWQYEKGLSGLKMDLDRAEQETRGLRVLLQGNGDHRLNGEGADDMDERITLSISNAETERDQARAIADDYRQRATSAPEGPSSQKFLDCAKRMDDLANQLDAQVQSNQQFRERLSVAVAKGEQEQKESTRKIQEMQKRLAGMEDSVLAAQQHSETALMNHDAEMRRIEDATSPRLQRLTIHIPEPGKLHSPGLSPLFRSSPRRSASGSGNRSGGGSGSNNIKKLSQTSLLEMSKTQILERKVKELEGLLREAEEDIQTVVTRVTRSQMDVAQLQTERDAAMTQMRKLQDLVVAERNRADEIA